MSDELRELKKQINDAVDSLEEDDCMMAKMATWKKRTRKTGIDSKSAKELLMFTLLSFFPRKMIELEYRFHPPRRWRWDYAVPSIKLGIEFHGSIWTQGRHTRGMGFMNDREKMNQAQIDGWLVLEIVSEFVRDGRAYLMIEKAIQERTPKANEGEK